MGRAVSCEQEQIGAALGRKLVEDSPQRLVCFVGVDGQELSGVASESEFRCHERARGRVRDMAAHRRASDQCKLVLGLRERGTMRARDANGAAGFLGDERGIGQPGVAAEQIDPFFRRPGGDGRPRRVLAPVRGLVQARNLLSGSVARDERDAGPERAGFPGAHAPILRVNDADAIAHQQLESVCTEEREAWIVVLAHPRDQRARVTELHEPLEQQRADAATAVRSADDHDDEEPGRVQRAAEDGAAADDPVVLGRNDGVPVAIAVVGARRVDARDASERRIVGPRRRHKVVDGGAVRFRERP